MQDRRVEPRIQSVNLINFHEIAGRRDAMPEEQIYSVLGTARTVDLSPGGCRVRCSDPLPDGAQLHFDLQLGGHIVSLDGTIVRLTQVGAEWDVGIRFDNVDDLAADGIRLYLALKET